jgi:hypothetical protein
LRLQECPNVGDNALLTLAQQVNFLQKITLTGCKEISEDGLLALFEKSYQLEKVSVEQCPKLHQILPKSLSKDSFEQVHFVLDLALPIPVKTLTILFKHHKERKNLVLGNCKEPQGLEQALQALTLAKMPALNTIIFNGFSIKAQEAVDLVAAHRPDLQMLCLRGPSNPEAIANIAKKLRLLICLVLKQEGPGVISDRDLEILGQGCSELKEIGLAGHAQITIKGLEALLQNCQQIQKLFVDACPKIGQHDLQMLSNKYPFVSFG